MQYLYAQTLVTRNRFLTNPCILAALLIGSAAHAERPLTYSEALRGAVEANPNLRQASFSEREAEASLVASKGIFDPTYGLVGTLYNSVTGGIGQSGLPEEETSRDWSLSNNLTGALSTGTSYELSAGLGSTSGTTTADLWPDPVTDQRGFSSNLSASVTQQLLKGVIAKYNLQNVTLSRQSYTIAQLSTERERQQAMATAAEAYWSWFYLSNLRDIAIESVEVAEEALRVGRARLEAGELAEMEVTRLEAALVQAKATSLISFNAKETAANSLLLVMGEPPDQDVIPATQPGDVPELELDLAAATEVAMSQNLDMALARAGMDSAEFLQTTAKHGRLPSLSAQLEAGVTGQSDLEIDTITGNSTHEASMSEAIGNLTGNDSRPYVQVVGMFTVPLGNRAAKGEADRTGYAALRTRTALEELERSVTAQVEEQVRTLESAKQLVELADANFGLAEATLRSEEALSAAGLAIQKDILEARTEVARTKAEVMKARTDYRVAQVALLALQGQLTDHTL